MYVEISYLDKGKRMRTYASRNYEVDSKKDLEELYQYIDDKYKRKKVDKKWPRQNLK